MPDLHIVISARTSSSRLPGKALLPFPHTPVILYLYKRLQALASTYPLVVATSCDASDDQLCLLLEANLVPYFRGSLNDVALRHIQLADSLGASHILRITADCPFVDSFLVRHCLSQVDLSSQIPQLWTTKTKFPIGLDIELLGIDLLKFHYPHMNSSHQEHLTSYFYEEKRRSAFIRYFEPANYAAHDSCSPSYTLDTADDYRLLLPIASSNSPLFPSHTL